MRIVIKLGTSTLAYPSGQLNIRRTEKLCKIISDLKNSGEEIIIVSSGAIGMGLGKLPINDRPDDMPTIQALAAVGQCELMYRYDRLFSEYNHTAAQILITASDLLTHEDRRKNFTNTLNRLLELGAIPIINENDSVATEEISFGDNDTLGAYVATCAGADMLIILSDIDGLFESNPNTTKNPSLISEVREINDYILSLATDKKSLLGTGGMQTKLKAADICMKKGITMVITNGTKPENLYKVLNGENIGTRFFAK